MKISIFQNGKYAMGIDYSSRDDCIGVFEISDHEAKKLKSGCTIEVENGELQIIETPGYRIQAKKESLKDLSIEDIENSSEGFTDANIGGKELGDLLIDKFYGGNPYAELRDHRVFIEGIISVLSDEQKEALMSSPKILELFGKAEKVKAILSKF